MNRRQFFTGAATVAGGALLTRLIPTASAAERYAARNGTRRLLARAALRAARIVGRFPLSASWEAAGCDAGPASTYEEFLRCQCHSARSCS